MTPSREILTSAEAMLFLRLPRNSFYTALREGRLPAFRIGRRYRFRRASLVAWMHEQEGHAHWRQAALPLID